MEDIKEVKELFAFVIIDKDGKENVKITTASSMILDSQEKADDMKTLVQNISNATGKTLKLFKFTERTELQTFSPQERKGHPLFGAGTDN